MPEISNSLLPTYLARAGGNNNKMCINRNIVVFISEKIIICLPEIHDYYKCCVLNNELNCILFL